MAKVHGSLTSLRLAQRERFRRVGVAQATVHRELARGGWRDFRQNTKGAISSDQLRRMGHPFGRLGGQGTNTGGRGIVRGAKQFVGVGRQGQVTRKGVVRPLPINKQTGELHRSIRLDGPTGRQRTYRLFSNAPHARFVLRPGGTRRMVDRGLLGRMGLLRRRHKARIAAAIDVVRQKGRSSF